MHAVIRDHDVSDAPVAAAGEEKAPVAELNVSEIANVAGAFLTIPFPEIWSY
jgi:hypothetical protein